MLKVIETYPSENWNLVGSTVLTGLVVVFIALILLIAAFCLIGAFFAPKTRPKPEKLSESPTVPEPAAIPEQTVISPEVIAVISAAVAAYGEKDGKAYRISSVRLAAHMTRRVWNASGLTENMRGF